MKKYNNKFYVVKRIRLYTYLNELGFKMVQVKPDERNPKYYVWVFNYTEELQNAIDNFYAIGY